MKRRPYFINARGTPMARRKTKKRKLPRRGKGGKFIKSVRRGGRKVSRKAWTRFGFRRNRPMARRLPKRSASGRFLKRRRSGGRRRRRNAYLATVNRRRRRRNPPIFTAKGILAAAQDAAIGGAGVVVGEIGSRRAVALIPNINPSQPVGIAAQFAVALGLGVLARQFKLGGTFGKAVVYGAAAGGVRSAIRLLAPDMAAQLLSGDEDYEVPLSAYMDPRALAPGRDQSAAMSAYATGIM